MWLPWKEEGGIKGQVELCFSISAEWVHRKFSSFLWFPSKPPCWLVCQFYKKISALKRPSHQASCWQCTTNNNNSFKRQDTCLFQWSPLRGSPGPSHQEDYLHWAQESLRRTRKHWGRWRAVQVSWTLQNLSWVEEHSQRSNFTLTGSMISRFPLNRCWWRWRKIGEKIGEKRKKKGKRKIRRVLGNRMMKNFLLSGRKSGTRG